MTDPSDPPHSTHVSFALTATPVYAHRSDTVDAAIGELDGRRIVWFTIEGGKHRGAIGTAEGDSVERAVHLAVELGIPIVGRIASSGADVNEGVASLHAWGRAAKALADASGVVPIVLLLVGPAVSGPALLLGLADHVIVTSDAFAYVTGPDVVVAIHGCAHRSRSARRCRRCTSGTVASQRSSSTTSTTRCSPRARCSSYLPDNHLGDPPFEATHDPVDRDSARAAAAVPARSTASYDVRHVLDDVLDEHSFFELRAAYAPSMVTGLGRLGGRTLGVIANQPMQQAGSLDIDAAQKAARFVQWCDCFNVPVATFVDTSGYLPGRDLEWRGIIRHGAQLLHSYAAATVPRLGVVLRKAYGGAYIVMDSRGPRCRLLRRVADRRDRGDGRATGRADPPPTSTAVGRGRRRAPSLEERELVLEYEDRFLNPYVAAERGYVDDVIAATDTRRVLAHALERLSTKREPTAHRRHSNIPL